MTQSFEGVWELSASGFLFLWEREQIRISVLPEHFLFSGDLHEKTTPVKWEQWSNLLCLHIGTLKGCSSYKILTVSASLLSSFHFRTLFFLKSQYLLGSQSLCVSAPQICSSYLFQYFPGNEWGKWCGPGYLFCDTAHKGTLACRLDASHQPIISQWKEPFSSVTSWRELIFQQSGLIWVNN